MLKVRVMGTKKDIKWFRDLLRDCSQIKVIEFSDVYPNKGTKTYYRAYIEVEPRKKAEEYIQLLKEEALYETGIWPDRAPLLLLITCSYQEMDGRFFVAGCRKEE